jgi:hypothetical protein
MMRYRPTILCALLALLAAACGSPAPAPCAGAAPSSTEIDAFLREVAMRRCAGALRCAPDEVSRTQDLVSETHCVEALVGQLRSRAIARAVSEGTVCADLGGREACLEAIERDGCEERTYTGGQLDWPSECATVIAANVAPGGACAIDEECTSGSCSCGECAGPPPPPGSCASTPCAPGFACNAAMTCVPRGHIGDACERPFVESAEGTCATNLLCEGGTCHSPEEHRTADLGEDCYSPRNHSDPRVWCRPGLACHFVVGGAPGTCSALLASGAPCEGGTHGMCELGTICHGPAGTATCAPYAAVGEECFGSGADPCVAGTRCAPGTSMCAPIGDDGASCASDADCYGFCNAGTCERSSTRFCS